MALDICRICGTTEDLKNIFGTGNDKLVEQIRLCANIQIDAFDSLPKFVCNECEVGLAFSYRLRKRGEETEKKLRQDLLHSKISIGESENLIHPEDSNLIEEYCEEEVWIKDEGAVHSSDDERLIDGLFNSNDSTSQNLSVNEEESVAKDNQWIEVENSQQPNEEEVCPGTTVIESLGQNLIEIVEIFNVADQSKIEEATKTDNQSQPQRNQFECEVCYEIFEKKSQYVNHVKIHGDKRFYCQVCDRNFIYRYRYVEHMKNHFTTERAFPCAHCNRSYTNQGNMERHVRSAHSQERKFQCAECGSNFARPDILKMHMAKHTEKRTIQCEVCKKAFKTNQSLHYHMKIHKTRLERPKKPKRPGTKPKPRTQVYKCDECNKISHHRTTHMNHIRTHTGEKPFKCSTCDKAFRTSHARSNHQLLHTDKRPHVCKDCGAAFRQISHLKSHMLTHTGDKRHVCEVCQKAFAMRSNLVVHLRIHTGELPYACNKCPKKFLLSSQFKRHKMSHSEEEGLCIESCKESEVEECGEFQDPQISLYIDEIIEQTPENEVFVMEGE